jgi:two-component system nitrate/nitrite response regulator NarL
VARTPAQSDADRGTRVFIVAQVRLYRDGLAEALDRRDGFEVIGTAAATTEAVQAVRDVEAEVVLLDMAAVDTPEAARLVAGAAQDATVVGLAVVERESQVIAFAEAGIASYVPREASLADLVATIEGAARGEARCSPAITGSLLRRVAALAAERTAPPSDAPLTSREREVLELVDEGLSNREIGRRLFLAPPTVKNHIHNILEKLQVRSRGEAAARVRGTRQLTLPQHVPNQVR